MIPTGTGHPVARTKGARSALPEVAFWPTWSRPSVGRSGTQAPSGWAADLAWPKSLPTNWGHLVVLDQDAANRRQFTPHMRRCLWRIAMRHPRRLDAIPEHHFGQIKGDGASPGVPGRRASCSGVRSSNKCIRIAPNEILNHGAPHVTAPKRITIDWLPAKTLLRPEASKVDT